MSKLARYKVSFALKAFAALLALGVGGFAAAQQLALAQQEETAKPPQPEAPPITLKGDATRGRILASTCAGCHGIPGYENAYPVYNVPKLGGQNEAYITVALQDYRRQSRSFATMQAQAAALSDQDIADVATYFASVKNVHGEPTTGISDASDEQIAAGKQKAAACAACHGPVGISQAPQFPNLAGQHASYLLQVMKEYKTGGRQDIIMGPMVSTLSEQDMENIAAFFAAQPGLFTIKGM
ncbi:MAG TPA: c-type cytochrome [Gammaproteobacteria bacterium]|nr:c-type cytochrome [Gammaproteobacteria bacterium]